MSVRLAADWMVLADERILEFLEAEGPTPPGMMSNDSRVPFSSQHINNRLWLLTDAGFTRNAGQGVYYLTDQGEAYLRGDFDARELEKPEN